MNVFGSHDANTLAQLADVATRAKRGRAIRDAAGKVTGRDVDSRITRASW